MTQQLGFSTGVFWNTNIRPISTEALDTLYDMGCTAVELGAGLYERWKSFDDIDPKKVLRFAYRSLHAPTNLTQQQVEELRLIQDKYDLHTIVVHPLPGTDWKMYQDAGIRVGLENMDDRKDYGASPEYLLNIISHFGFKWVLDINHIYTHDRSMKLAHSFIEMLGEPAHIHLSGYDPEILHTTLFSQQQKEIIQACPPHVPIISESDLERAHDVEREFHYIKQHLA